MKSSLKVNPQEPQPGGIKRQIFTVEQNGRNDRNKRLQALTEMADCREEFGFVYIPTKSVKFIGHSSKRMSYLFISAAESANG